MALSALLLTLLQSGPEVKTFAPGEISTAEFESHPEFSLDGRTLYFVKSTPEFTDWRIVVSRFRDGKWTKPTQAPFSDGYRDADPFITPDGKRLFFISDRPAPGKKGKDMDVWYVESVAAGWGEPVRLGSEVNSANDEWYPTTTVDGALYFGSDRAGGKGGTDIWVSKYKAGKYQEAENLGSAINTTEEEIEPFVTPDGKLLIFNASRATGLGGLDIYVSKLINGAWSRPKHLAAPVNSPSFELSPKLSRDGRTLYFSSARRSGQGLGDIFFVDAKAAGID